MCRRSAIYYCVFMVVDLLAATVGFVMEKREDWSLLWWLMLQRFGYRQLMYYVVVRSIFAALRGPSVGWGKLERAGTVKAEAALARHEKHAVVVGVIDTVVPQQHLLHPRRKREILQRIEFDRAE